LTKFNILYNKSSGETRNKRNIQKTKPIYDKLHTKWRKNEIISSKVRKKTKVSLSPLLINIELAFLATAIRERKKRDSNRE
jgi:ribosomal protein L32E